MTSSQVRHLNFLNEEESAAKRTLALNYLTMSAIVVFISLVAVGYSYTQKQRLTQMQDQLTAVSAELVQLREQQLKSQQDALSVNTRKQVVGEPVLWSSLLKKMAKKVPGNVKLSQISGTIGEKRTLVLKGFSPFVLPIFRLKDNFSELKECTKSSLVSIEQAELTGGEEQLTFQLECTLS